jgi:hypothetical protein
MSRKTSRRIGKLAVKAGLVSAKEVNEAGRILAIRADIGEACGLDQILFERKMITAEDVSTLQSTLQLKVVHCPECQLETNQFGRKAGSTRKCPKCKARIVVPGVDTTAPYSTVSKREHRQQQRPAETPVSTSAQALGLCATLVAGSALGGAAWTAWGTGLQWGALAAAGGFTVAALVLLRAKRFREAGALGLLITTCLVVVASAVSPRGVASLAPGLEVQALLAPLVLVHVGALLALVLPALRRINNPWLFLGLFVPLSYALLFFGSRCIPGADVATFVSGPAALDRLPWYLHPGLVTLLGVFPAAAVALLLSGLYRRVRHGHPGVLRQGALALSLLLLSTFGLSLACMRGTLPSPDLCARVGRAVGAQCDPWMAGAAETTALAVSAAEAPLNGH